MTIKTFNGIAAADVKTINGIAVASVKTWLGEAMPEPPSSGEIEMLKGHIGYTADLTQNQTVYVNDFGHELSANEARANQPMAYACTIDKLYAYCSANVGGAGQTVTITLRKNGADTALTCAIGSGAQTASDLVNSVAFAAGDLFCWKVVLSATTGNVQGIAASARQTPT